MLLRRYHEAEGDPPEPDTDSIEDAPPAAKPTGRSTSAKRKGE